MVECGKFVLSVSAELDYTGNSFDGSLISLMFPCGHRGLGSMLSDCIGNSGGATPGAFGGQTRPGPLCACPC